MRGAFLILISAWVGTAVVALPCPSCPKQRLYLPTDKTKFLSDPSSPTQKTNSLLSSVPAYPRNSYPGDSAIQNNKKLQTKYGHRVRTLGEEAKAERNRYVYDPRRAGNSQDSNFLTQQR
jgi:hypothetical protein